MALAGLHIEFSTVGVTGRVAGGTIAPLSVYGACIAAQTLAIPGTSDTICPQPPDGIDAVMVTVKASVDSWVTIGPGTPDNPATATSPRRLVYAGVPLDQECQPGDAVRWSAA